MNSALALEFDCLSPGWLAGLVLVWLTICLWPCCYSPLTFPCLPSNTSHSPSIRPSALTRHHPHISSPANLSNISFLLRPRLGLVISGVTRFCPSRLPAARLPAYTRLGHCYYSTRPPHPRAPWPYAFTSTVMSSSDDDQPLGKGTSRACFLFISFAFASVTQPFSQSSVCFLTKSRASGDLAKILFPASPRSLDLLARLHRADPPCSLTTFSSPAIF